MLSLYMEKYVVAHVGTDNPKQHYTLIRDFFNPYIIRLTQKEVKGGSNALPDLLECPPQQRYYRRKHREKK
jgi:hypothetical protein